jgi:hypothetical protein
MVPYVICSMSQMLSNVHPRLWHYQPPGAFFRYQKTQHICNVCGVCMYEGGDGLRVAKTLFVGYWALFSLWFIAFTSQMKLKARHPVRGDGSHHDLLPLTRHTLCDAPNQTGQGAHSWGVAGQQSGQPAFVPSVPAQTAESKIEALERLAALCEKGSLSEAAFQAAKQGILS